MAVSLKNVGNFNVLEATQYNTVQVLPESGRPQREDTLIARDHTRVAKVQPHSCIAARFQSVRALRGEASACMGRTQETPAAERPTVTADPALVQRPGQGTRERDGQERAGRLTASLFGTWSGEHRSGSRMEPVNSPRSPCRSYGVTQC